MYVVYGQNNGNTLKRHFMHLQSIPKETHIYFQISLRPLWGRGAKNSHGRLCKWEFHLHNRPCNFLAPPPGGLQKNLELNVRFFWNRLYY